MCRWRPASSLCQADCCPSRIPQRPRRPWAILAYYMRSSPNLGVDPKTMYNKPATAPYAHGEGCKNRNKPTRSEHGTFHDARLVTGCCSTWDVSYDKRLEALGPNTT
ncbi:uncharacterized protein PG986_010085 [Apiospora aurea]|uniref:Uncharacterized protein n=1 Tax=Apiospora aurea TaxID=335848 RepID=A0ABR1Q9X8_9PEZI